MEQAIQEEVTQSQETRDEIARVFAAQYKRSVSYVMARGVNQEDAEDVVQTALAITLAKYDPTRGAKVGSFFVTVLRSRCMEFLSDRHQYRARNGNHLIPAPSSSKDNSHNLGAFRGGQQARTSGTRYDHNMIEQLPDPATTDRARFLSSIYPTARKVAEDMGHLAVFDAWYGWERGRGAVGHAAGILGPEEGPGGKANWKHRRKVAARLAAVMVEARKRLGITAS